jgi:histidyl-tRNA synthetase
MWSAVMANEAAMTSKPGKNAKLVGVKGMNDIMPPESAHWERLEEVVRHLMGQFGYQGIRTPILEPTGLFVRGLGEATDVVEKEMYSFTDRLNGESLTLRPENTAGVVRAAIEHSMLHDGGKRLYYMGPMFRHERPQRGRYRQFHQIGAEALGYGGYELDAEMILLADSLWKALGLTGVSLELNCLGQPEERRSHRAALVTYFTAHRDALDEDSQRRLVTNPLRILDTKNPDMQALVNAAPRLIDCLGPESQAFFDGLKGILDQCGVTYSINPRLVRGLDYYNLTVFEFVTTQLGSQGTICGGGRYDYLFEQVGGKAAPAVGWAIGMERVLELLNQQDTQTVARGLDVYVVIESPSMLPLVMSLVQQLRQVGLSVQMHARGQGADATMGSMKSQFKRADGCGARFALVFGQNEVNKAAVGVKNLRDRDAVQAEVAISDLLQWATSIMDR